MQGFFWVFGDLSLYFGVSDLGLTPKNGDVLTAWTFKKFLKQKKNFRT
jgi:hypothetical protein